MKKCYPSRAGKHWLESMFSHTELKSVVSLHTLESHVSTTVVMQVLPKKLMERVYRLYFMKQAFGEFHKFQKK